MKAEFRAGVLSVPCKKGQREKLGERNISALSVEPFIELNIKKKMYSTQNNVSLWSDNRSLLAWANKEKLLIRVYYCTL